MQSTNVQFSLNLGPHQKCYFHFKCPEKGKLRLKAPSLVFNDQVPILRRPLDEERQARLCNENLLIEKIMPFLVKGETPVQRIAEKSGVNLATVKMVIQHLVYFRLVRLIDLFQFANVYQARAKLAKLVYSTKRQKKFKEYLKINVRFDED